jgi:hypothetical protein
MRVEDTQEGSEIIGVLCLRNLLSVSVVVRRYADKWMIVRERDRELGSWAPEMALGEVAWARDAPI